MGSLQDDSSDQYYSGAARRLNGNLVVYRHRQAPNATATYQHGAGANQFQSKSTSSTLYASGGRAEPWQQLLPPPQQQQQQQVRAAGSEQPAVITRQGGGQPQPLTSTRRDYVGSQPWSVSNGQTATHTRNISRPQTPAGSEYGEDRYRRGVSGSPGRGNHVPKDRGGTRTTGSSGGRHVPPVGSILKLAPRHDRVAVVESTLLSSSWNDDKQVRHQPATGTNSRELFARRSIDAEDPRAPPVPPPRPRSRASSSSPSRLYRASPGSATVLQKSTPSTTPRQQRRVLFKNNVAVYRFDSDSGADSSAYSSMSESSEMLNGEPRHHHGNRQQHRIGSGGGNRLQNGCNGYGVRPQPPVPGDPDSDRPHVMPIWYGPPDGQLTGSSIRPPASSTMTTSSMGQSPRVAPPSGEQLSTLWVDDPRVPGQMLATNRSTTMVRVRYIEVRDGPSYRLVVTCQLRSGSYWDSDDIVVKANRAGSRVRIVFGGSGIAGPSDQLVLPFTVDPYRLVARLEPDTTLVIEAPIINR